MDMKKKNVALVLSSGGAKGYAHIGVIKALQEEGYNITSVAGTSMGAMIGGLYAAGKLDEAYAWLKTIDNWNIFKLADLKNFSIDGIINGEYIFNELHKMVGDVMIEDLSIPFCAVAAELDSGKEKVFTKGKLLDAIRASISMPVFFNPYKIGRKRYVDGGVVNGMPTNRVKRTKDDIVIAINLDTYGVSQKKEKAEKPSIFDPTRFDYLNKVVDAVVPDKITTTLSNIRKHFDGDSMITILLNSYYIALKQNKLLMQELSKPDIYLNIDLKGYTTNDFNDAETIARLGYEQMKAKLASELS